MEIERKNGKLSLEEATIKALYDGLDSEVDDVEGLIDDVLVVTDPEITEEEYEEVIDRAQEIVEDTPEGEIPYDEEYLDQYLLTCPICGSTFVNDEILEPGATCPICLDIPEAFVVKGTIQQEEDVEKAYDLVDEETEEGQDVEEPIAAQDEETEEDEEQEELVASEEVRTSDRKLTESNNDDVELPSTTDGTAKEEIQDMLDRAYDKKTKVGIEEAKSKVTHEDDKTTMTEFTFEEEDVKFVQELLGPSFDVTLTDEQGVMDIKLTHNEYVDGGIVNLTDDFVRKVIEHVKESQPNVKFNSINRNTTIILTPDIQDKQTESKELDEKRLGNNTFTDRDEAEYYRNKELYANSGLERHREAMEKAKGACEQKGIELDETQGVYEGKKLTEGECLTIDGPITDYIDIKEDREQWDYPLEDEDEAMNNNDYCVKSKADNRIYEVTTDEWNLIANSLNETDKLEENKLQEEKSLLDILSDEDKLKISATMEAIKMLQNKFNVKVTGEYTDISIELQIKGEFNIAFDACEYIKNQLKDKFDVFMDRQGEADKETVFKVTIKEK